MEEGAKNKMRLIDEDGAGGGFKGHTTVHKVVPDRESDMKCSICGRKLRNPKSRELGYGPVCYKRKLGIAPHTSRRSVDTSVPAGEAADHNLPGQISMEDYLHFGAIKKEQ